MQPQEFNYHHHLLNCYHKMDQTITRLKRKESVIRNEEEATKTED
jgi:hypothetical protein